MAIAGMAIAGMDLDAGLLLNLRHLAAGMRLGANPPRSNLPGGIVHKRRGRGLEVHDVRMWMEGDDIRHLDRNVTARTGVPHVRTFRDERERATLLVADFRPSMLFGTRRAFRSVAAGESLAMLGWQAMAEGGRVGLVAATPEATHFARLGRGARAMIGLVGEMVLAHQSALHSRIIADKPLADTLADAEMLAGTGATICIATGLDAPGDTFDAAVSRLARRHEVIFVLVADAFEVAAPAGTYPYVSAEGAGGWLNVARQTAAAKADGRVARLRALGVKTVVLESRLDAEAMALVLGQVHG